MPTYDVPGVYIEEVTGPGVITGVGTSTAAFIGPALNGPIKVAQRISSYDEFLQNYGIQQSDGSYWPYITTPKWYYMAHGVRSFFLNGGAQAYIMRVGTAKSATWKVDNEQGETVFQLQAQKEGAGGNGITIAVASINNTVTLVYPTGTIAAGGLQVKVTLTDPTKPFLAGDTITDGTTTATITQIQGNVLTLTAALAAGNLRIADIGPTITSFRVAKNSALFAGTVALMAGVDSTNAAIQQYVVIQSIDQLGFVTLTTALGIKFNMAAVATAPTLVSQDFQLKITPTAGVAETWPVVGTLTGLSLSPLHPNYVFSAVQSAIVNVLPPSVPPTAGAYPNALVDSAAGAISTITGSADDPSLLTAGDYSDALDLLQDVEDVNLLVIPDAAITDYQTIQNAMIDHCLIKKDRFPILDSRPGSNPSGAGSVEEQRQNVQADSGFGALYYPWLTIPDPTWTPSPTNATPATMIIPPSGALAGVYARVDQSVGVHKAPANTDVKGVVGLERKLSDRQQGPLNLEGIDVLRIFPGSGQVTVWGARTTGDPNVTDWIYVNVRRLMIYIEQSIEVGIRWAVFEPNGLPLWQKLKRTITEFLTRVWRDGALFGATADQAFYVRIDEALNPPSTRALGRLYIEIGVAPVRPAEFIIVRIGLWDGGAQVTES
ncbi:MAG TPA: phage tail sheath subtilisin-like domain-containing protein [Bryobacteraceae bacterium]|jgi:phage tail sheath protein FI|nr:phage tail sheath subtilisin-like domain-containing protein [Bryobacteraceae bacterium]HTC88759.1 phage tail sheath subtilisin-like domain-containing protein [Bryobacteraceae bacterium]